MLGLLGRRPRGGRGRAERDVEANATEPLLAQPSATQAMAANYAPDIAPPVSSAAEGLASAADGVASAVGLNGDDGAAGAAPCGRRESFGGRRESLGGRSPSGAAGHAFHFGRLGGSPRDAPGAGAGVGLGAVGRRSSIGGGETVMQRSLSVTSDTATLLAPFDREAFCHADRQLGAHGAGQGPAQYGERPGGNEEAVAEDDGEGSEGSAPIAKWHQIPNVRPCVSGSMCTRFILFACSTMVKKVGPVFVMTL